MKILKRSKVRTAKQGALLHELEVMKKITHPHVIPLYEVINDLDHNEVYMIFPLLPGPNLQEDLDKHN